MFGESSAVLVGSVALLLIVAALDAFLVDILQVLLHLLVLIFQSGNSL